MADDPRATVVLIPVPKAGPLKAALITRRVAGVLDVMFTTHGTMLAVGSVTGFLSVQAGVMSLDVVHRRTARASVRWRIDAEGFMYDGITDKMISVMTEMLSGEGALAAPVAARCKNGERALFESFGSASCKLVSAVAKRDGWAWGGCKPETPPRR